MSPHCLSNASAPPAAHRVRSSSFVKRPLLLYSPTPTFDLWSLSAAFREEDEMPRLGV